MYDISFIYTTIKCMHSAKRTLLPERRRQVNTISMQEMDIALIIII